MQNLNGMDVSENNYHVNYKIAEQFAYLIGKEELLKMHFYNDIQGIRNSLQQYGLDFDELCELSKEIVPSFDNMGHTNQIIASKYQEIMNNGFIRKRCKELGIENFESYCTGLSKNVMKKELEEIQKFMEHSVIENSSLSNIKERFEQKTKKKSIMETIKSIFTKKQKMLPEGQSNNPNNGNKNTIPSSKKISSWDLSNWDMSPEELNQKPIEQGSSNKSKSDNRREREF